jgi:predicted HTH transcriptional regulator
VQVVGREDRHTVFRPGLMEADRREDRQKEIATQVVGFLNTNEGGTMFFGVNEGGEIKGLLGNDEQRLTEDLDIVIKSIGNEDHNFHYCMHFYKVYK